MGNIEDFGQLVTAVRMLATGTLSGSPLNSLGHSMLGGLAFLQGDISVTGVYSQLVPDWDDVEAVQVRRRRTPAGRSSVVDERVEFGREVFMVRQ